VILIEINISLSITLIYVAFLQLSEKNSSNQFCPVLLIKLCECMSVGYVMVLVSESWQLCCCCQESDEESLRPRH